MTDRPAGNDDRGLSATAVAASRDRVRWSVLVINFNAGARLLKTLAALEAQTEQSFELVLFDNASTDGSDHQAESRLSSLRFPSRLIRSETNLGFAAGNNAAARHAKGEWLLLLNPDAYPDPDWLEKLSEAILRFPAVKVFGSLQVNAGDPRLVDGAGDVIHALGLVYRGGYGLSRECLPKADQLVASPCAAAMMVEREAFLSLGGFDERFFCYCEDLDLGLRLRAAGHPTVQLADAVVAHEGSAITGRRSRFAVFHGQRNRQWLLARHLPAGLFWPLLPFRALTDLAFLIRMLPTDARGAAFHGLMAGYAAIPARRREHRAAPKIGFAEAVRLLEFSVFKLLRREPHYLGKPLPPRTPGTDRD
ncbi:glycosyltransferase family 2 protein [Parvularcula lutaonensis]|uniref:Glycosyltransferase family 2 protein n=1 Tax=Parvularcula lutaonensis TaxID=491923 RepID=A0ABV7M8P8_9PROT|nr:glycosyltransferase family 2 protein [Parvularcula lutaonensis]GGY56555.1 hypothetical protein GCM10007148_27670 [Parvularcula lutaonensis]